MMAATRTAKSRVFLFRVDGPDKIHCSPRESGSESSHHDLVTLMETGFILIEAERDGCSRGIAVILDIYEHSLLGYLDPAADGLDYAEVGLMRPLRCITLSDDESMSLTACL